MLRPLAEVGAFLVLALRLPVPFFLVAGAREVEDARPRGVAFGLRLVAVTVPGTLPTPCDTPGDGRPHGLPRWATLATVTRRCARQWARRWAHPLTVVGLLVATTACGLGIDLPSVTERCDLGRGNDQGVAGHDLAASTTLPDGRVLFVFGDTYLGTVDGDERSVDGLLNQTAAVIPAGDDICSDRIRYLTDDEGSVRGLLPAPPRRGTAYWPVDVGVLDGTVWMLYRWVEPGDDGHLDIRVLGTGVASAEPDDLVFEPLDDLLVDGDEPVPASLVGVDDDLVTLVCGAGDDEDGCTLRRLDPTTPALGDALPPPPVELAATEMSLARTEVDGEETWRASSMPGLTCRLRVATLEDGEWDERTVLAPEPAGDGFCYAGRVQEHYSTATELVVTWVENATERRDADAYWPHVVHIDLSDD